MKMICVKYIPGSSLQVSLRKNLYRIGFLLLGFVLTLAYFGAPGPRTSKPPPAKLVELDSDAENLSSELSPAEPANHLLQSDKLERDDPQQLLALERELTAKLGQGFEPSIAYSTEQADSQEQGALPGVQQSEINLLEKGRARLAPSKENSLERSAVFYDDQTGAQVYGSFSVELPSRPISKLEVAEQKAPPLVQESADRVSNKEFKPQLMAPSMPVEQKTGELAKLMAENVELREELLTLQILLGQDKQRQLNGNAPVTKKAVEWSKASNAPTGAKDYEPEPREQNIDESAATVSVNKSHSEVLKTMIGKAAVIKSDRAGLRAGPSMNYALLSVLPAGQQVTINYTQGNWVNIATPSGLNAWLLNEHLATLP